MASTVQQILDSDSEDEIPPGWEERVNASGKVYYANHETQVTQWTHPTSGKKKTVKGELPFGWERFIKEDGTIFFVDHVNQKTTYTDPRLAFAKDVKGSPYDIRQKFDSSSTALQILHGKDLSGKYIVVTGSTSGIGFETARSLALHGANVVLACRHLSAAQDCKTAIIKELPQARVEVMYLELSSLKSVKEFAETYKSAGWPLHILILNAGVFGIPWQKTQDGLEMTFQVNHLAHFYLTLLLQEVLISSSPSRVIVVSSESHRFSSLTKETVNLEKLSPPASSYSDLRAYNDSKLCNVLFANELSNRLSQRGVTVFSLHPGNMMSTSLTRYWWGYRLLFALVRPFTKSMQQGAATTVYCTVDDELEGVGGLYFNNCCRCLASPSANDPELATALWQFSLKLLQTKMGNVSDALPPPSPPTSSSPAKKRSQSPNS